MKELKERIMNENPDAIFLGWRAACDITAKVMCDIFPYEPTEEDKARNGYIGKLYNVSTYVVKDFEDENAIIFGKTF